MLTRNGAAGELSRLSAGDRTREAPSTALRAASTTQRCPRCRRNRHTGDYSPSQVGTTGRYCRDCLNRYRRVQRRANRPPGYAAMHLRVTKHRGPARKHTCWDCGQRQAKDWAYTHDDDLEIVGTWKGRRVVYSLDVMRYRALCRRCHQRADAQQ